MTLPLLLGEAPSKSGDRYHAFPLSGRPATFVCDLLEIPYTRAQFDGPWWRLQDHFEVANLIERYPGSQGKGAAFPMTLAREAARDLFDSLSGRVVVLLGSRLGHAMLDPIDWSPHLFYTLMGKGATMRRAATFLDPPAAGGRDPSPLRAQPGLQRSGAEGAQRHHPPRSPGSRWLKSRP